MIPITPSTTTDGSSKHPIRLMAVAPPFPPTSFRKVDDHLTDLVPIQPILHAVLDVIEPEILPLKLSAGLVFNQRIGGEGVGSSVNSGGPVPGPCAAPLADSLT